MHFSTLHVGYPIKLQVKELNYVFFPHTGVILHENDPAIQRLTFPTHTIGGGRWYPKSCTDRVKRTYLFQRTHGGYPGYPIKLHYFQIFSPYIGGYPASCVVFILVSVFSNTHWGYPKYLLLSAKEQIFFHLYWGYPAEVGNALGKGHFSPLHGGYPLSL